KVLKLVFAPDAIHPSNSCAARVKEVIRGMGLGRKIFKKLKEKAIEHGCFQLQWQTPEFNTRAISFYKARGALSKKKFRFFLESK
ncbi:MAG: GNAT family N-acetyltransferase, partial [Bacteroidota bacterium]